MRWPVIFRGPGGPWDVSVFRNAEHASAYAEAIDVVNGEYGNHGWDADGNRVVLVPQVAQPTQGWLRKLLRFRDGRVEVHEIDAPPEPGLLREVLTEFVAASRFELGSSVDSMSIDDLIALVMSLGERLPAYLAERQVVRAPRDQLPKPLGPVASVTWLVLLLSASFGAWLCHAEIATLRQVRQGFPVLSPGALLFLVLLSTTVIKTIGGVALSAWALRVAHNIGVYGATPLRDDPVKLVVSWFVPVLNWATLYRGLGQLWYASSVAAEGDRAGWAANRPPVLLVAWLLTWISHGIGILASIILYFEADQYVWFICWIIRDAFVVLAAPLVAAVIFKIGRVQARALAKWVRACHG